MTVFELKIAVAIAAVPAVDDALAEREEQRFMVLEDKPSNAAWLAGYFDTREAAEAAWADFAHGVEATHFVGNPQIRELPDANWKESYKAHFKAWQFGALHWVPVWERATFCLGADEQVLWLDPGMAFGTGNHETTRLVVERLVAHATEHGTGARVIDAGCGSGILALSAAKLGFQHIAAFDNDPVAVQVSEENAAMNGLTGRVEFYVGDLITGLAGRQAEFVMANIQADVLIRFARELVAAVAPRGWLILSGILERESAQVREVFSATAPRARLDVRVMGEWSDLLLIKLT